MNNTNRPAKRNNGSGRVIAPGRNRKEPEMADSQTKTEWDKSHTTFIGLKLNKNTDAAILEKLASVPSKQGYIKQLIRADLAAQAASK